MGSQKAPEEVVTDGYEGATAGFG